MAIVVVDFNPNMRAGQELEMSGDIGIITVVGE